MRGAKLSIQWLSVSLLIALASCTPRHATEAPSTPADESPARAAIVETPDAPETVVPATVVPEETAGDQTGAKRKIRFEQTIGRQGALNFNVRIPNYRWARDGVHIEYTIPAQRRGERPRLRWIHPETLVEMDAPAGSTAAPEPETGRRRPTGENSGVTGESEGETEATVALGSHDDPVAAFRALLASEFGLKDADLRRAAAGRRRASGDGKVCILKHGRAVLVHRVGEPARVLLGRDAPVGELEDLNADGSVMFVHRAGNAYLVETQRGFERKLTSDGSVEILNGKLDWALQEEIYGRGNWNAKWFSPDGANLAFLRLDQSKVKTFSLADDITTPESFSGSLEHWKYPKAGEDIPTTKVAVAGATAGKVTWVDLSKYDGGEFYVVRVGWTPDSKRLWLMIQDRIQTWLDFCFVEPTSGKLEVMFRETSDCWVDVPEDPKWLADGGFLWESQRSGYNHLYRISPDGKQASTLTTGQWSVRRVTHVDQATDVIEFQATKDGYWNRNLYRIPMAGGEPARLTAGDGSHDVRWRADRAYYLNVVSSLTDPGEARLCRPDGSLVKVLATGGVTNGDRFDLAKWQLHTVKCRDGYEMEVAILPPVGFQEGKKWPVWIPIYLGPDLPNVRNTWDGSSWNQYLAQEGYFIMRFDARSATAKGRVYSKTCYPAPAVQELRDAEDAVSWIVEKGWGDPKRIGITGTSYGGYMSAYALAYSDKFAFGWSNAGLYDWRGYDAIYAERYLRTPQENKDGYDRSSVIVGAKNLKGHLVITHGTMDENVHMQSAMRLAYALQVANKPFEMMMYPENRHGVGNPNQSRHLREMMWDRMQKHLPPGGR